MRAILNNSLIDEIVQFIEGGDGTIAQQQSSQSNNPWHRLDNQPEPNIDNNLKSTTPWPELGQRRRQQTTSPASRSQQTTAPKRDFVASPRPNVNQAASNNARVPTSSDGKRDFVSNPQTNINQGGPKSPEVPTWVRPTTPSSRRDFVSSPRTNVNIQQPNINQGGSVKSPEAPTWVRPTTPSSRRDFVSSPRTNVNIQQGLPNNPPNQKTATTISGRRDYASSVINNRGSNLPNNAIKATPSSKRDYVSSPRTIYSNNQNKPGFSDENINNKNIIPTPSSIGPKVESTPADNKLQEDNELRDFSEALLKKDVNNAAKFVKINYQGKTRSSSTNDEAPEPYVLSVHDVSASGYIARQHVGSSAYQLLTIHPDAYNFPSVEKLIALHNNYILESHNNEVYTAQEKIEENNFLDTILPTSVMQHTRNFLVQKGKIPKDPKAFRDLLKTIWFNMYSRGGGKIGSSGFEHVFVAEIKNNAPSGLHNWLYFNAEEKKNTANYLGYMKKIEFDRGAIVKFHFNFHDKDKPVGSMFIGTSPELEFALYSTCFIMRADDVCPLRLGGNNFIIRTYIYRYRGKNMIGSAFPDI